MLTIKKCFLLVALSMSAGISCTKLDEEVYDKLLVTDVKFTAKDVVPIMAPAYSAFRDIFFGWDGVFDASEDVSDLAVTPNRIGIGWGDYYITLHQHTWNSATSDVEAIWSYVYTAISTTNKAIYDLEQIENLTDKQKYINELRALRATYYYILLDYYRNVPIVTDYDLPAGFLPEQSTGQQVYDFIMKELTESVNDLSEINDGTTYGRMTKWAAKMTLAKMYLNSGVFIGVNKWDEALAQVNDIINSEKFQLADNYKDPFLNDNAESVEEILSIPYDEVKAGGSYYPYKTLHPASQATFKMTGAPWGGTGMIPQFINTYDPADKRLGIYLGGPQVDANNKPIIVDGAQLNYTNYMGSVNAAMPTEGYRMVKYEIRKGLNGNQGNDAPFYRYTDALMIKAECLLRKGDADGAAAIVTQIRGRDFNDATKAEVTGAQLAGGSTYQYGTYENGSITRLEGGADIQYGRFLDELAWEFIGEARRRQDLIRFGVFTTKSWLSHTPQDAHVKIFPIPFSARNTNSKLQQNPGY
ncbi:outer membrane protein SusD [Filimonas lacunae]|nr:outer membrane protein SusD [Filimonas lacunae]